MATWIIGLLVLGLFVIAAKKTIGDFSAGKCSGCSGCSSSCGSCACKNVQPSHKGA